MRSGRSGPNRVNSPTLYKGLSRPILGPRDAPSHRGWMVVARGLRLLGGVFAFLITLVAGYGVGLFHSGNFHVLVAGEAYRSAQPTPERLNAIVRTYGVRSVLNLRGENRGSGWYDAEVTASRRLGVTHIDYRMSSKDRFDQSRAQQLIEIMRTAPKPLLIHCNGGADRSGLASALYLAAIAQQGHFRSELQLSPIYGHVPLPFLRAFPMTSSFESLEGWLGLSED